MLYVFIDKDRNPPLFHKLTLFLCYNVYNCRPASTIAGPPLPDMQLSVDESLLELESEDEDDTPNV